MVDFCVRCGYSGTIYTKVKQLPDHSGVSDIGFECPRCGEQWGFRA